MTQLSKDIKIGIHSLGLIGGSIYKCLAEKGFKNLYALSHNQDTISQIKTDGYFASDDISILEDCDVIFVCTPISETINAIKEVFEINKNAIIADVASLKENILNEIEKLDNCKFIASHPMAGTENSGFNSSFAGLFMDANWAIIPSDKVSHEDIKLFKNLVTIMDAKVVELNSTEHDKAVALISHLPMLLSQSLVLTAKDNKEALLLAASGFRDTTRLAMSNKTMAKDMLQLNQNNIKTALQEVIDHAQELLNSDFFDNNIENIIQTRKNLYNEHGKNNL